MARFQVQVLRDVDAARATLEGAIREAPATRELWVAYYALEAAATDKGATRRVAALFEAALGPTTTLPVEDQRALWALYVEHVEDLGPDVHQLLKVRDSHDAWLRKHPVA